MVRVFRLTSECLYYITIQIAQRSKTTMKSLIKALDVLEAFLDARSGEIRLSEIAKKTGLHKATVNRITSVFVNRGYLNQVKRRGKYTIGNKFLSFSALIREKRQIVDIAMPYLVALNKVVKESVALFQCNHDMIWFVEEVHSKYPLRLNPEPDHILPLYCTSAGKIFLASKSDQELDRYFTNTKIKKHTTNTIVDLDRLKKHLLTVASDNVAYDNEEWYAGVRTVAAGIWDANEKLVGCIDVTGPSVRISTECLKEFTPFVKQYAMKISLELGYREK